MYKHLKFFLTSAAIAAALVGVSSCTKDYQGDIDDLNKKVTELSQKLSDLQTNLQNGEWVTNVEKTTGGIKVTTNKGTYDITNGANGKDGKDGKDGTDGKDGKDGKDGSVVKVGDNGHWFIDDTDTGIAAAGTDGKDGKDGKDGVDGKDGKDGSVVTIGTNGNWFIDDKDTGIHAGGISAVWTDDTLTIYDENGDLVASIDLKTRLQGLAFVPERIFDGLGLITVYQLNAPKQNTTYPYINYDATEEETVFLTTSPTEVTYRMDAENIDISKYTWDFVNRTVFTVDTRAAAADDNTLVAIEEGPVQDKSFVNFKIQLTKQVDPVALGDYNDIVALRAVDNEIKEPVVSDYAYIDKEVNWGYRIIHKDGTETYKDLKYVKTHPYFYRVDYVDIDKQEGPTEYNDGNGIVVNQEDANPATPVLVYNNEEGIDLLDYVETYGLQIKDLVSTKGIEPEYTFTFAGWDTATDKIMLGANAKYETKDNDKTDQNKFLVFFGDKGSKVKVNKDFVSTLAPAIGRTPLIYVQSKYNGKLLADAFIKLEIIDKEPEPRFDQGYKLFIKHGAEFDYDKILYTPPYKGEQFTAPLLDFNTEYANKYGEWELNVGWEEMNVEMFNALGMSYENFQNSYFVSSENVKIVVVYDKDKKLVEPGDFKADDKGVIKFGELGKDYELVPFGDFDIYYGYEETGIDRKCEDPGNWQQNTNIVSLSPNKKVKIGGPHFVYVVYEAQDNMVNPNAVVKFVYNIKHDHTYTISKWLLNPDYILGNQNELNPEDPVDYYDQSAAPYNKDDKGWGAVRIKGQNEDVATGHQMRSGLTEHFLKYMKDFEINDESTYEFQIMNYEADEVSWEGFDSEELKIGELVVDEETNRAAVVLKGTELKQVIAQPALVPYIYLNTEDALIATGYDVLIQVTETCEALAEQEGYEPVYGYYYVVFQALKANLKLYNVKLGTFKEINDYVLAPELVEGIFDEYNNLIFEYVDGEWTATDAAEIYGFTDAADLTVTIDTKLKYPYEGNDEKSFGGNLYVINVGGEGETPVLAPTETAPTVDCINWWNLGTDLRVDKKAQFGMTVMWGEEVLCTGTGEIVVLATANSIHPLHSDANGTIWAPVVYKDGWFYAVAEEE